MQMSNVNLLQYNVNINFEELLFIDDSQYEEWIQNLRKFIISEWD